MKQEYQDIAVEVAKASPGIAASSITLNHVVAIVTILFVVLQILYLVRKWVREETEWGRKIKRWSRGESTDLGGLEADE